MDGVDSSKQSLIQHHVGDFPREPRLDFKLDRLDLVAGGDADQMKECALDAIEGAASAFECEDRIVEARRRWIGFDSRDLRPPLRDASVESGAEMLKLYLGEGRGAEGGVPGRKEGIVGQGSAFAVELMVQPR